MKLALAVAALAISTGAVAGRNNTRAKDADAEPVKPPAETVTTSPKTPTSDSSSTTSTSSTATTTTTTHTATTTAKEDPRPPRREEPDNSWMETHGQIPRFDLGGSFGYNNSAGMLGIETEYRLMEFLGVGLHGGIGLWGVRLTPVAHAYPFGASNLGLFGEAALSLNLGGDSHVQINDADTNLNYGWSTALGLSVGYRRQWLTYFWTSMKLGYQWRIGRPTVKVLSGTDPLSPLQHDLVNGSMPGQGMFGGFVFGGSAGIAFL